MTSLFKIGSQVSVTSVNLVWVLSMALKSKSVKLIKRLDFRYLLVASFSILLKMKLKTLFQFKKMKRIKICIMIHFVVVFNMMNG